MTVKQRTQRFYLAVLFGCSLSIFMAGCDQQQAAGPDADTSDEAVSFNDQDTEAPYLKNLTPDALALHYQMADDEEVRKFLVASAAGGAIMRQRIKQLSRGDGEVAELIRKLRRSGSPPPT